MEQIAISLNQIFGWTICVSFIVACLINALWSIYFNRIKEGQKAEFLKEIEFLKTKQAQYSYISKVQFETEFNNYKELSKLCYSSILQIAELYPTGYDMVTGKITKTEKEKLYNKSFNLNSTFRDKLFELKPFVDKEIYTSFELLLEKMYIEINYFKENLIEDTNEKGAIILAEEYIQKTLCTEFLLKDYFSLAEKIRFYVDNLKIIRD